MSGPQMELNTQKREVCPVAPRKDACQYLVQASCFLSKITNCFVIDFYSDLSSTSILLFGETAGERAKETGAAPRTLSRKANEFEQYGMQSLFSSGEQGGERETSKTLPEYIRQLIVDLHSEHPTMAWREIAEICYIRYGRKPSHHSVKHIATSGPPPGRKARRYQPWHQIPDPAERKLAVVRLHSEGWSVTSIAEYLQTSRVTVYETLERWAKEGVAGLDAKPQAGKGRIVAACCLAELWVMCLRGNDLST